MAAAKRTYRDLDVWQEAMTLVEHVYTLSGSLPETERFGLISQMQRAAVSVPANIAEGYGRRYPREFQRFLAISRGSLMELETYLLICGRLNRAPEDALHGPWEQAQTTGRLLNGLIRSVRSQVSEPVEEYGISRIES